MLIALIIIGLSGASLAGWLIARFIVHSITDAYDQGWAHGYDRAVLDEQRRTVDAVICQFEGSTWQEGEHAGREKSI